MRRLFWQTVGWAALGLAAIGTALPVLPTVPFLLVAAWAFSRSSPEIRERIRNNRRFGRSVRDWQDHGIVSRLAKGWATIAMALGVIASFYLNVPHGIVVAQALICLVVAMYLWTRPSS